MAHSDAEENVEFVWEIKNPQLLAVKGFGDGVPGRIRTCDAGIRRTVLGRLPGGSDALEALSITGFRLAECLHYSSRNTISVASW